MDVTLRSWAWNKLGLRWFQWNPKQFRERETQEVTVILLYRKGLLVPPVQVHKVIHQEENPTSGFHYWNICRNIHYVSAIQIKLSQTEMYRNRKKKPIMPDTSIFTQNIRILFVKAEDVFNCRTLLWSGIASWNSGVKLTLIECIL